MPRAGVAGADRAVAVLDQLGEAQQVQVGRVGAQQVAGRAGEQHGRRLARPAVGLEHPAQVGDVGLQRAGDRRRRVVAPQRAHDPVDADDAAGVGQQQGQQRPGLGPADVQRAAVGTRDLERAEDSEAHEAGCSQRGGSGGTPLPRGAARKSASKSACKYPPRGRRDSSASERAAVTAASHPIRGHRRGREEEAP